jgi:O-antigen/teichoic acid export membrane protein
MDKKKFGKNEITFTVLRYFVFGLQTIRGFVLAYYLGPYFLGIYGYLMLYQQYLSYSNLGFNYSVNSELAIIKEDIGEQKKIINSAFTGVFLIAVIIGIIAVIGYFLKIALFPVDKSYQYIIVLAPLSMLINFQQIFVNIFRIQKKLTPIIIGEFLLSIGLLTTIFFFKDVQLINAIFYIWVFLLLVIIFIYRYIYNSKIFYDTSRIKLLLKSGLPLLIYAFSYYLMNLLVRSLIGAFYPVEIMGYFSFANNITTAIMLGLDTITWLIFPSIIAKLSDISLGTEDLKKYLVSFTNKLIILVLLITTFSILALPILFLVLPKYKPIESSLIILLINQIIFNSGFAFISLCIARKMQIKIAIISLLSVLIGGSFGLTFSHYNLSFIWLVVSNVIASLCFINILIYYVSRNFKLKYTELLKGFDIVIQLILCFIVLACLFNLYWVVLVLLGLIMLYKIKSLIDFRNQIMDIYYKSSP